MPKKNVAYVKPQEPSFLRKLKEQIGYKEGPTVDTKREALETISDDEYNDEEPTVVVLKSGDLTAEEAAIAKEKIEKEKAEAPANLNQRIVFKVPEKSSESSSSKGKKRTTSEKLDKSKEKKLKSKSLLSFDDEEDDL